MTVDDQRNAVHRPFTVRDILTSSTSWRVKAVKSCDWLAGRLLLPCIAPCETTRLPIATDRIKRILVIRAGGVGDAILSVPFLRELTRAFPGASIDLLAEVRNAGIFSAVGPAIDRLYQYDYGFLLGFGSFIKRGYDLVFDTEQWHYVSALLAAASGAPIRVGFDTNPARRHCYTVHVPYRHEQFEGESFLRMLSVVIGCEIRLDWTRPFLDAPRVQREWAKRVLPNRTVVAVALKGSVPERCWEPEKFQGLLSRLSRQGLGVCLLGSRGESALANAVCRAMPQDPLLVDLTGRTSWEQTAAILAESRVFLGTDSALMHLAYAVGTPVVALFGAGIQAKWAPPGTAHRIINHHLSCSPCTRFGYTPPCPINVQCLREISVEEVLKAVGEVLAHPSGGAVSS